MRLFYTKLDRAPARSSHGNAVVIEPSNADRKPTPKKLGSEIVKLIDPFRKREIYAESGLEENCLTCLISRPNVIRIREQFQVSYTDDGMPRDHYVDVVVDLDSGTQAAFFIKPADQVARTNLEGLIQMIKETGNHKFHEYRIVTEQ